MIIHLVSNIDTAVNLILYSSDLKWKQKKKKKKLSENSIDRNFIIWLRLRINLNHTFQAINYEFLITQLYHRNSLFRSFLNTHSLPLCMTYKLSCTTQGLAHTSAKLWSSTDLSHSEIKGKNQHAPIHICNKNILKWK